MTRTERMALLKELLAIDSSAGNEKAVADCLQKRLQKSGVRTKQVAYAPDRNNLVAEMGERGPVFALSGHLDVVPPGDTKHWASPPFTPTEREGKLYARGATDMKSGLAAMAAAMMELADEKTELPGRLRLFATVGEETGLLGAEQLTKLGYANDVEALIIGEPTGRRIVCAHKGIVTATITSYGKTAHSSMPEHGVNAIDHLLLFYNRMETAFAERQAENATLGRLTHCNSVIEGGEQFNMVPDRASLSVNVRTIPEAGNEDVLGMLREIIAELNENVGGMRLEIAVRQSDPPVFNDVHSRLVETAQAEAKKMFGKELPVLGAPGATDAAKYIQGNKSMQIIIFGPGNSTMHQDNECVEEENYLEMIDLYKNIVKAYFAR